MPLLEAVLPLLALDTYVDDPVAMMQPVSGDELDPTVEARYRVVIDRHAPQTRMERADCAHGTVCFLRTGQTGISRW
jgi:L-fucose mutarotase